MSDYEYAKTSKLVLKGEKRKKKSKKSKSEKKSKKEDFKTNEDSISHGGWWFLKDFLSLTGSICIEVLPHCYLKALDNGTFKVGDQHELNEGPDQEEIFTCIRATDTQVAFKSGFNKYLSIDSRNRLIGRSDAIGDRELFVPVFQDEKLAILASNKNFLSYDEKEKNLFASSYKVSLNEILKIRSNVDPEQTRLDKEKSKIPEEERGSLQDCEEKYLKKFQSKTDYILSGNGSELKKAKNDGNLHEVLLDRRAKKKSDKFCK